MAGEGGATFKADAAETSADASGAMAAAAAADASESPKAAVAAAAAADAAAAFSSLTRLSTPLVQSARPIAWRVACSKAKDKDEEDSD